MLAVCFTTESLFHFLRSTKPQREQASFEGRVCCWLQGASRWTAWQDWTTCSGHADGALVLRRRCTVAVAQQRRASAVLGFAQQAADAPQHGSRGAARCRRRACAGPGSVYAGGANTSAPRAHARLPALLEAHDWVRLGASGAQALWHCSAACYGSLGMLALMHRSTRPSLCSLVVPFDEAGRHGSTGTLWTSPSCAAWCTTRAALTRGCCCCARTSAQKVGELWHVKGQRPA